MSDKDKTESTETQSTSPVEDQTSEENVVGKVKEDSQPQPPAEKPVTEPSWDNLSGDSQERFRTIIKEKNNLKDQLARQAEKDLQDVNNYNKRPVASSEDEVGLAVKKLKERGMATKEDIDALFWRIEADKNHESLEREYDGSSSSPKYIREEVEDYARRKGMGINYRAAYRDMYFDELRDAGRTTTKPRVVTEKPVSTSSQEEPLTIDKLKKELSGPNRIKMYEKYAKNPEQFDKLLRSLSS